MKSIVIATNNKNKVREFKSLFDSNLLDFKTLNEIGYDKEIIEDGQTFKENALIKARQVSKDLNCITISDDSGLVCEGLNGAPGIYSARYSGTHNDELNNELLIKNITNVSNKNAKYVCAICIYYPNGQYKIVESECKGQIITTPKGQNGFGYDPYFYIPEFKMTFAEVPLEKKNTISHRAKALKQLKELVDENFNLK